eukprot:1137225-Pelagomonas_calceolata.AAC.4
MAIPRNRHSNQGQEWQEKEAAQPGPSAPHPSQQGGRAAEAAAAAGHHSGAHGAARGGVRVTHGSHAEAAGAAPTRATQPGACMELWEHAGVCEGVTKLGEDVRMSHIRIGSSVDACMAFSVHAGVCEDVSACGRVGVERCLECGAHVFLCVCALACMLALPSPARVQSSHASTPSPGNHA